MLSRARVALTALTFGSMVAWALSSVPGCAVNQSGLSLSGSGGTSGTGGSKGGATGTGGGHGGAAGNLGAAGTIGVTGTAGTLGAAGTVGAAGSLGSSGAAGTVGASGAAGTTGSGNAGTAGTLGTSSGAGTNGNGPTGGSGQTGGTGGAAGTFGQAGTNGGAGTSGNGPTGAGGTMHGNGGNSGHPDCSPFPSGSSTTLSSDGLQHCYWDHTVPLSWTSAESACEGEGGTLATILSAQENGFVTQLAAQDQLFQGGAAVWLGASDGKASNDMSGPGIYSWVTGEAWGYTNWHPGQLGQPGQPDGSCSTCTVAATCFCDHWLAFTADGTWYDRSESVPRPYICEAIAR